MKHKSVRAGFVLVVLLLGGMKISAFAQQPRVAVLDFRETDGAISLGQGFESVNWTTERTQALGVALSVALSTTQKFQIIERAQLGTVNNERVFSQLTSGVAYGSGGFGGADYCVLGELSLLNGYIKEIPIPHTQRKRVQCVGSMVFNIRLVSVQSGKILLAKKVVADLQQDSVNSPQRYIEELQQTAIGKAVVYILEAAFPAKITNIVDNTVFINRGEGGNYELGMRLNVYAVGKPIIDPDTGKKLGETEIKVGEIAINEIQPKFSKAIIMNNGGIQVGMVCRQSQELPVEDPRPVSPGSSDAPIRW